METFFKGSSSSLYKVSIIISLIVVICGSHYAVLVNCTEFEVGGQDGWAVPKSKDNDQLYNQWASQNRFKVGDTLHFKYEKDSVLVVSEEEYEKCRSSRPLFFSNNGDTVFTLERPGMFYFISGVSGHCAKGQKMIVKVLEVHTHKARIPELAPAPAPQSENVNVNTKSNAASAVAELSTSTIFGLLVMSLFIRHALYA